MKKFLFFLLSISTLQTFAQLNYCGTQMSEEQKTWLKNFQQNYTGSSARTDELLYVPLKVHIVGNDDGTGYISVNTVLQDICDLNDKFEPTGFYFYLDGEIDYINNSDYYVQSFSSGEDMMYENNDDDAANVYFVSDPAGNCGYFTPSGDGVAVANSCAQAGETTLTHELGHFFSLPHTFNGWEWGTPPLSDQEKVDGTNCNDAGDGFCDTPPDYAAYRWSCSSPPTFTDPEGVDFQPDGSYYMSYSNDECTSQFSTGQMDAMNAFIQSTRYYLLVHPAVEYTDVDSANLIEPENGATNQYPNYTVLKWESVPNATGYSVEVSYNFTFSAIIASTFTTDTLFIATTLGAEHTYYWRVKVIAEANTCEPTSVVRTFSTGAEFTAVNNIDAFSDFVVSPNPVKAGSTLKIDFNSESNFNAEFKLYDITGNVITSFYKEIIYGSQGIDFQIPDVAEGMYVLQINNGADSKTIKISVAN